MSSPAEFYNSLPPITKAYGTLCLAFTTAYQLGLFDPAHIALLFSYVLYRFQVWRLITNFFFLGKFSINFGIRLLMIARYGVQLEKGPFDRRTADFLWMMIFGSLTLVWSKWTFLVTFSLGCLYLLFIKVMLVLHSFPWILGIICHSLSLDSVFGNISCIHALYLWSREFPNANINIYGLVTLKAFYLPWAMLALDVIFGSPIMPDLLGIIAGHLYYFLTVLHPLATGKTYLKTPRWVRKLVSRNRIGAPSYTQGSNPAAQPDRNTGTNPAFRGRSYRLSD